MYLARAHFGGFLPRDRSHPDLKGVAGVLWVDDLDGDQGDAEVADFHQQPMELSLVGDGTADACRAVAFPGQDEVIEPGGPPLVEVPLDPKPVAAGCLLSFWRSGS